MGETVGLIGIGLVGTALAEHLLAAGCEVVGFDIDPARCRHLESLGGRSAGSPAEVARHAARVLLSLLHSGIVRDVVEGPGGILEADPLPRFLVDTGTGDPEETAALAARLAPRGLHLLDAPLSGSSRQVRARESLCMAGGAPDAFHACRDLLDILSGRVFYVGPPGSGARAKLASNLVLGLNRLVLAEGLVFAERLGLEPESFLELLKASPARSAAMDAKGEKMLRGNFEPESRIRQHHKDVTLILQYAAALGQELPLTRTHREILEAALAAGDGDLDNAAVIRELRRRGSGHLP